MNKVFSYLINLYIKQLLFTKFASPKTSAKTLNKAKDIIKKSGFVLLIIYSIGFLLLFWGFISLYIFSSIDKIDENIDSIEEISHIKDNIVSISISLILSILGFLNVIITFLSVNFFLNLNSSDEILLSLPIKSTTLFSAKVFTISLTNGLLFILMNIVMFFVYGYIAKVTIDYYFIFIIQSISIQFFSSLIAIILSLLLVNIFKFLRNKDLITYLSIFIFLPIIIAYNLLIQQFMQNPAMIQNSLINLILNNSKILTSIKWVLGPIYLYSSYIAKSVVETDILHRYFHYFIQILIIIGFFILTILIFSPIYKKLLLLTNIQRDKKERKRGRYFSLKQNSTFFALFKKEIISTYREPTYFINGPFVIILLPIIFGVLIFFQSKNNSELKNIINIILSNKDVINFLAPILVGSSFLIGDFSNITSTAISREGKNFGILKTLPIKPENYISSKLAHGLLLTTFGSFLIAVLVYYLLKINIIILLLITIISVISSVLFHVIALFIDMARPKLNWDNPIIAMKQNINAVISIFLAMGYSILLFFQTKYFLKFVNSITFKLLPNVNNQLILLYFSLLLLLILVIIENLLIYFIFISRLKREYYKIEL